jgi:hypothetical protein
VPTLYRAPSDNSVRRAEELKTGLVTVLRGAAEQTVDPRCDRRVLYQFVSWLADVSSDDLRLRAAAWSPVPLDELLGNYGGALLGSEETALWHLRKPSNEAIEVLFERMVAVVLLDVLAWWDA